MRLKIAATALCYMSISTSVYSDESASGAAWPYVRETFTETWNADNYELFIPINTWHNRHYYSSEKIDQFNEHPWGLGIGKYRYDADGDWHSLYMMAFLDSHKEIEPIIGYAFEKIWRPNENWRLGAGYTVGATLREDYHYLPIPVAAPMLSVEYKHLALQSAYIIGGNGNGNILFTWLRWQLK